ncbi:MAG: tripartite tricarboxylate transporter substrate-binding protein [Candidatus Binatia bacterium]
MSKSKWTLCIMAWGLILAVALPLKASGAVSFAGKTVVLSIAFGVGGGSDRWARTYAPYLSKFLPGNPTVMVRNIPGGGGITGVNRFVARAKTNGKDILGTSGSNQIPYLLGDRRVKYEYKDLQIILASPVGGFAYISPKTGVKKLADLKSFGGKLFFASQGATSLDLVPLLAFETLGLKVKPIFGYKGRGPGRVAFEQGEVNIDYQTTPAYLKAVRPLAKEGKAFLLFSWGQFDSKGNLVRDPVEPNLPHFTEAYEIIHGKKPSGPAYDAWKAFFVAGFAVQKPMWLPKGTPPAILKTYRDAARKIMQDPRFQKDLKKKLGGYPQYVGKEAQQAFDHALNVPPDSMRWLKKWLKERFKVQL